MASKQKITVFNLWNWLFHQKFFAGIEAELEFADLAANEGYIIEKIPQDRKSFEKYIKALRLDAHNFRHIKRGDFTVRNLVNLEVEVKCFSPGTSPNGQKYFTLKYRELKGLEAMSDVTKTPICIAIFERSGRAVKPNSLKMVSLKDVMNKRDGITYNKHLKSMRIPASAMLDGFELFDDFKKEVLKIA